MIIFKTDTCSYTPEKYNMDDVFCERKPARILRVINKMDFKMIYIMDWCDKHGAWVNQHWTIER